MADRRILIVALILGAVAAGLAVAFLASAAGDPVAPADPMRLVVVAKEEIPAGAKIQAEMLETKQVAESAVIADAATDINLVVGETARYPMARGEQVSAGRLVAPPKVQALSFQIPQGLRGMTIPVSISETPAALIAPGDFVDVIMLIEAKFLVGPFGRELLDPTPIASLGLEDEELRGAYTLMQNIQVLTVDRGYVDDGVVYDESVRGQPPEEGANVGFVTLAVTPEQAQALFLAQQEATLTIVLRPFGDDEEIELRPFLEPFVIE
jgi:pilus assembly protein CpaB